MFNLLFQKNLYRLYRKQEMLHYYLYNKWDLERDIFLGLQYPFKFFKLQKK